MRRDKLTRFIALLTAGTMLLTSPVYASTPEAAKAGSFAGAYLAGRVAGSDNHMNLAIDYFRQALSYEPNNVAMQKDMLLTLLSVGDFKEAVAQAHKLKGDADIDRFVRLTLATDALNKKSYNTARALLEFKDPSDMDRLASGLLNAWATYGRGNRGGAIDELKKLLGPVWYDLFLSYHLALMSDLAGRKQDAERYYNQALNDQQGGMAAPDTYERVIVSYASFQLRNKKREEALKILREGETLLSGRDALKNMRQQVEKGGSIDLTVKTPQDGAGEVLYDLGTAINRAGAEAFARIFLQLSLALRPKNDATIFQLAEISAKLDEHQQAVKLYGEINSKSPYFRDGELRLALSLADAKENSEAIEHLTALEKEFPDDRRISMALAGVYMQEKNFGDAAKVMERAISFVKNPQKEDWLMYYQRGIAYERLKEWDKAEPDFREALMLFPNQPQVLNYLGYSLIDRSENLNEALNMVKKAVDLKPQDGYIVDSLGWAYYKLGRYDDAVQMLERAIKINPEDPTINDHRGDAYWQVGRKLEATFQWNHAIAGKPEPEELAKIEEKLKTGLKANSDQNTQQKADTELK